jgi:two-component system, chemotaxis family, sensor kinase CheA
MDMGKYLGLFVSEAGEHLEQLGADLVRLERAGRQGDETAPVVDGMFRHAHSVKGMAGAMQFDGIARLAHRVEDLLGGLRGHGGKVPVEVVDALLLAVDGLQAMVLAAGDGAPCEPDPRLLERIALASASLRAEPGGAPLPPATAPPPGLPEPERPAVHAEAAALPVAPARRLEVAVEIAGSCPVPAVRGFLVLKKLAGLGSVLGSSPSAEDLKAGRIPGQRLDAVLESSETPQAVERALSQISDLASVSVHGGAAEGTAHPAPEPAPGPRPEPSGGEGQRTVRVRTELLDYFLDTVGELILAAARLREVGRTLPQPHRGDHEESVDRLNAIVKELHNKVMAVRMTPIAAATDRLPRAVRDLARKTGKQVEVAVAGADIEIDRAILDELGDPLLHLVRNAVDHGIEAPHLRLLAGKPAAGRISVSARRERDRVIVEIADDGRGLDPARLREAAVASGAIGREQAAALSDREAYQLACLPGVSTAETVTDVSGRGVGMDAVKKVVEAVGGTLEIGSTPGLGARFLLRLPLTVAVQSVLLVRVGEEVVGLPIAKVHGAAEVDLARLERSQGGPLLPWGSGHVPVHDLSRMMGVPDVPHRAGARQVVVADVGEGYVGLAVDALLGQQEAVLKPLAPPLDRVPGLSAVTVLGNGRPVFVLDVSRLLAA